MWRDASRVLLRHTIADVNHRAALVAFVGFLCAVSIGFVNQFAFHATGDDPLRGRVGLTVAGISVVCAVLGCVGRRVTRWQYGIAGLATLTALAPVISAVAHSQPVVVGAWIIALATLGAVLCASAADPTWIRTACFWLFAAVVCASLTLGTCDLFTGGTATFRNHYEPRYSEWLGLPVLSGITGHQNTMGMISAIALTFQVAMLRNRALSWPWVPALWLLGPVASAGALIWSQSRTALGAAVLGLIVVFIPVARLRGKMWAGAWAGAIAAIVILPVAIGMAGVTSFTGRVEMWRYAFEDFAANPVFGYGMEFMRSDAYWASKPTFPDLYGAHNQFFDTAGRSGIVGLASLTALFVTLVWVAWMVRRFDGAIAVALVALLAVLFTQESVLPIVFGPRSHLREVFFPYLAMLAIIVAGLSLSRQTEANDGDDSGSSPTHTEKASIAAQPS